MPGGADQPGDHRDRRQQARRDVLPEAERGAVENVSVSGSPPLRLVFDLAHRRHCAQFG
jgi:hypothetical protein